MRLATSDAEEGLMRWQSSRWRLPQILCCINGDDLRALQRDKLMCANETALSWSALEAPIRRRGGCEHLGGAHDTPGVLERGPNRVMVCLFVEIDGLFRLIHFIQAFTQRQTRAIHVAIVYGTATMVVGLVGVGVQSC